MNWLSILGALLLSMACAFNLNAQATTKVVEVYVTAVSGENVYIDAGRLAGIEPGDKVEFQTAGATAHAFIRAVSKSSSRAELTAGSTIDVGDRGQIHIPLSRLTVPSTTAEADQPTDKIEWEALNLPWEKDLPLLSQVAVRVPAARESVLSGRLFTVFDQTWDDQRDQRFLLIREGVDATLTNPFNDGGELHLDVESFRRETTLPDETITDSRGRLDRLSYSWGGTRERATRFEVGRFLHHEFSELGVIDGAEVSTRTGTGSRYGMSLGLFPDPRSDFRTGEDVQASVFYKSPPTNSKSTIDLDWGVALQNTWHKGDQDRNLLVGELDYKPTRRTSISVDTLVDYYGHGDVAKSDGPELTEFNLRTRYNFEYPAGVGAYFSHRRWPELLRDELSNLTPEQLRDNRLRRVGVDAWSMLYEKFRLSARAGTWRDQSTDGNSASARVSARDWFYDKGEVAFDYFRTQGAFSKNDGYRVSANHQFASSIAGIVYDSSSSEQSGFIGDLNELATTRLRLHWDITLSDWSISSYVEKRSGDEQDSYVAGLFLQYRF